MTHFYHNVLFSALWVKVLFQPDEYPGWMVFGGNSPAGYSAVTMLLPITQKIRHHGKIEPYLTQWHT